MEHLFLDKIEWMVKKTLEVTILSFIKKERRLNEIRSSLKTQRVSRD